MLTKRGEGHSGATYICTVVVARRCYRAARGVVVVVALHVHQGGGRCSAECLLTYFATLIVSREKACVCRSLTPPRRAPPAGYNPAAAVTSAVHLFLCRRPPFSLPSFILCISMVCFLSHKSHRSLTVEDD